MECEPRFRCGLAGEMNGRPRALDQGLRFGAVEAGERYVALGGAIRPRCPAIVRPVSPRAWLRACGGDPLTRPNEASRTADSRKRVLRDFASSQRRRKLIRVGAGAYSV